MPDGKLRNPRQHDKFVNQSSGFMAQCAARMPDGNHEFSRFRARRDSHSLPQAALLLNLHNSVLEYAPRRGGLGVCLKRKATNLSLTAAYFQLGNSLRFIV